MSEIEVSGVIYKLDSGYCFHIEKRLEDARVESFGFNYETLNDAVDAGNKVCGIMNWTIKPRWIIRSDKIYGCLNDAKNERKPNE